MIQRMPKTEYEGIRAYLRRLPVVEVPADRILSVDVRGRVRSVRKRVVAHALASIARTLPARSGRGRTLVFVERDSSVHSVDVDAVTKGNSKQ